MHLYVSCLILLSGVVFFCSSQTFQYSRGWTNGKRNEVNSNQQQPSPVEKSDKYNK